MQDFSRKEECIFSNYMHITVVNLLIFKKGQLRCFEILSFHRFYLILLEKTQCKNGASFLFVMFRLFLVIEGFRWFWMGSLHASTQLMLEFLKVQFLVLHFPYYTLMTFLKMFKHPIYGTNQTMWTGTGSGLLISKLEKVIDVRMDGSVFEEKSSFKVLKSTFFSRLDWGSCIISIAKTASRKIRALIRSIKFLFLMMLCISINLPYAHAWKTVVMCGLVLLFVRWNCQISYKNGYEGMLVLHVLRLLNR